MTRAQARERQPRAAGGVLVAHAGAALYGSDRMALESVEALHAAGLRPTLCLPADGPLAEEARRRGLAVVVLPFPVVRKSALSPRGALRFAAQTARAVPALVALLRRERCSAVYVNTMTVPVWVACARFLRLPVLVHVHEAETTAPRPLQALLAAPLLAAHTAVYNSEYSLRAVTAVAPSTAGRSQVVYNGVAGPPSGPSPAPPSSGPLRVLYLGRVSERKGVLVALDAVEELLARGREVHLQVVGDTFVEHEAFAALVRERTSSGRLRGRVTLHGFSDAVWSHLEACHVLVVPSVLPEPFGNTAAEGLLAGRPVLASDIGGLPEVLRGTSSSRLVPAGDAGALADELDRLASDLPARGVQAQADAVLAAVRFAPAAYGRHIVDAVSGVLS